MSEISTNELYKDFITVKKTDSKNGISAIKSDNKLERTPSSDKFESQIADKKKTKISKNTLIKIGVGALGISAAATAFFCGKKVNSKVIASYANELDKINLAHNSEVEKLQQQIADLINKSQSADKAITEALEGILQSDNKMTAAKSKFIQEYTAIIEDAKLSYDPMNAPAKTIYEKTFWAKIFKLEDIKPLGTIQKALGETLDVSKLKSKLLQEGKLSLTIPSEKEVEAVMSKEAFIDGKIIPNLGKWSIAKSQRHMAKE